MFQGAIQRQPYNALFLRIGQNSNSTETTGHSAALPIVISYCGQSYKRKGDATEVLWDLGALPDATLSLSSITKT
jgi:hypothetical protein